MKKVKIIFDDKEGVTKRPPQRENFCAGQGN